MCDFYLDNSLVWNVTFGAVKKEEAGFAVKLYRIS